MYLTARTAISSMAFRVVRLSNPANSRGESDQEGAVLCLFQTEALTQPHDLFIQQSQHLGFSFMAVVLPHCMVQCTMGITGSVTRICPLLGLMG